MKKVKLTFDEFFQEIYQDEWEQIKKAIQESDHKVLRPCFKDLKYPEDLEKLELFKDEHSPLLQKSFPKNQEAYYALDYASALVASLLPLPDSEGKVLDMCAAPGGKSLILRERLALKCKLVCNEINTKRRLRLLTVLKDHMPSDFFEQCKVIGSDGSKIGMNYPDEFDSILVDAPCSSEAHLLRDPKYLKQWTPNKTKKLAKLQYSLLCSALLSLKPDGHLMYSTCSLSPHENFQVIKRLLSKKKDQVEEVLLSNLPAKVEKQEPGYMIFPHLSNHGPMYFCLLKKLT